MTRRATPPLVDAVDGGGGLSDQTASPTAIALATRAAIHRSVVRLPPGSDTAAGVNASSSRSMRVSPMSRRRRLGSFSRQRASARRTASGVVAGRALQSGARSTMAAKVSVSVPRPNTARPVSISYSTHPKAHTSDRLSTFAPRACSGLM